MRYKLLIYIILFIALPCFGQTYVFFGSYNWDKEQAGLYVFTLDTVSGNLTKASTLNSILNPSYITLSPNGNTLYSITESKTPGAGSVSSFRFNPKNASLTFINSQPSQGENPVYVSVHPDGKWLAEANYTDAGATLYPINADGSIGKATQHFSYTEGSINPKRQEKAHVHSALFSPDGKSLFLPDLGADKIHTFRFDPTEKQPLQDESFIKTISGSGPRHLAFHPNGKWAYCVEEIAGAVSVYSYNNSTLSPLQRIATHPESLESEDYESSDVHITPDGRFLYASNRGSQNNIAIYSIAKDGILTLLGYEPTQGLHPRTFTINPSGKFLIVANVNSSSATVFKRDAKTGLLEYITTVAGLKNVTTVVAREYR
ncbi:6-phosphogluconolactonase [Flavobacterium akiainvivens]|uniref:6-phosphogluconolactonase n=1 Tax=Flavobacterium akiainvivens TaxID=1202724 RepID=A0A0M9VIA1_9FLAO|nr:lactonase family protein [Flavobacterium akiainvivens]KOS06490.1 6-phosphogluconolactonase [Flavobacterium akiainvivens]SFQ12248.1 6-phosphogluconolactonase, cycloisomerase 2 family [Flavobacterium akiainvivens]